MAGHSHWKQIKTHKSAADERRGALFSKLLRAITVAARNEPNPDFNPTLRTMVEKARAANVPRDNIIRAIERGRRGEEGDLHPLTLEAYGPEGVALLIEAVTESKNRTIMEIKAILKEHEAKWAEPGSVRWAFSENGTPVFSHPLTREGNAALQKLIAALEAHDDVTRIITNAAPL